MESVKTNAIIRRPTDTERMPPPPKRIKRPKNVLDEETYTNAISGIIARDFFPGLLETETQQEYLDALDSRDEAWISRSGRRLQQVMTPGRFRGRRGTSIQTPLRASETPSHLTGDTPMSNISSDFSAEPATALPEIDTNMSLDKFQSLYTSDDNESFYKLLDEQNNKRSEKYAWMWSPHNKLPSKMMLKQKEVEAKLLLSRGTLLDGGGERNRLAIRDVSEKPARPDSWNAKPDNGLMFAPDSVEDSLETVTQRAQAESRAAPKGITYINTRLRAPGMTSSDLSTPPSPSLSAIKDAIGGRRRAADLESGLNGNETPRVNGYAFVDDEPEPEPHTPIISIGKGESIRNPFVIKEQSKREDLHHRMVDKNAKTKRDSSINGMTGRLDPTCVPRFATSSRVGSGQLTPAARRLWSRVGNATGASSPHAFAQTPQSTKPTPGRRSRWTPSGKQR